MTDPDDAVERHDPVVTLAGVRQGVEPTGATNGIPARRLHPAWIVIGGLRVARGFVVPLGIAVFVQEGPAQLVFLGIGLAVAALGLFMQFLTWSVFRYEIAGGELRIRSGLVFRQERSVPLERIQSVDSSESPLQRFFHVVQLNIETAAAGTKGSDVTLAALSQTEAVELLERLNAARTRGSAGRRGGEAAGTVGEPDAEVAPGAAAPSLADEGELLRKITLGDLLLTGATSGRIGPALALLTAAWQFADDVLSDETYERLALRASHTTLQGLLFLVGLLAAVAWVLAFISTVLTFGGFELRRQGDRLLIRHGLLDRKQSTVPVQRIQAVSVRESLLRQPLRLATVRFESAGYGTDSAESGVLFPIVPMREVTDLLERAVPGFAISPETLAGIGINGLPRRARRRYVLSEVWPALVVAVGVGVLAWRVSWLDGMWAAIAVVLVPIAGIYGLLQYRDAGWEVDGQDRLVVRGRRVERQLTVTPRRRLQRRSVSQNVLQRRADLANLTVAIASGGSGGTMLVRHMDLGEAEELVTSLASRRDA